MHNFLLSSIVILCSTLSAHAATLVSINAPSNVHLKKFSAEYLALDSLLLSADADLVVSTFKIKKRRSTETWENTIKQAIYIMRSGSSYSRPDEVDVTASKEGTLDVLAAIRHAGSMLDDYDLEQRIFDLAAPLKRALRDYEVDLFIGGDGNSFGGCANLVVVDQTAMELFFVESCYAE